MLGWTEQTKVYVPAASAGTLIAGLGDDDSALVPLPFPFPFFGASYRQVYINSDGNLTFLAAESASTARLTGRVTGGPPRIAPLFDDLDPSRTAGGVRKMPLIVTPRSLCEAQPLLVISTKPCAISPTRLWLFHASNSHAMKPSISKPNRNH